MTERTTHTPGPWTAHGSAIHGPGTPTGRDTTIAVACGHIAGGSQVSQANAALIAAAPDLLAVAVRMVKEADDLARSFGVDRMHEADESLIADARAAIAKATPEKSATATDCPLSARLAQR